MAQEQGILGTRPRLDPRALNLNSEEANERNDPFCRALSRSPQKKAASRMNPFLQSNKYSKGGSVARRFCLRGWVPGAPPPLHSPSLTPSVARAFWARQSLSHFSSFFSFLKIIFRNDFGPGNLNISTESFFSPAVLFF